MSLNILKLCVGCESVDDLIGWHRSHPSAFATGERLHVTRMWPKRQDEVLDGGSLYWVIKGVILCRQTILRLDEMTGADGIRRCGLVLDPQVTRTEAAPRRPFQGWRYLDPTDSPPDLRGTARDEPTLPPAMAMALAELGVR
ncbi:MAG: DUF1489 domain-containing protein [Pseudorhodobacter sp.]|nr:DUF1489 domain-containing protein [Pseudorhodobacter sp.]